MQRRVSQKYGTQGIGETSHEKFFKFQPTAESEAQIGRQRKVGRKALELVLVVLEQLVAVLVGILRARGGREGGCHAASQGSAKVGEPVMHDLVELVAEDLDGLFLLFRWHLQRQDEIQHVRMASRQALSDDLEGPRHDVGTFDRDADWHVHVGIANVIHVSAADGGSGGDVHAALDDATAAFGAVLLHDGRNDHGCLVVVDDRVHEVRAGNVDQGIAADQRHGLLDAAEFRDGNSELLADARVGTDCAHNASAGSCGACWQADTAAFREAFDEHVPPESASFLAAQDVGHWDPNVFTFDGSVHEGRIQWHVTTSHAKSGMVASVV
mmetsp:Transcript_19757/g.55823  ORF Transcript_19757/g.55823 Transcript_19757/m.55823 type:complete len:326 (-) Transcript_19757:1298-2275(-)